MSEYEKGWVIISKSIKPHRIAENFDVHDFELTNDQMERIDALDQHKRVGPDPDDLISNALCKKVLLSSERRTFAIIS